MSSRLKERMAFQLPQTDVEYFRRENVAANFNRDYVRTLLMRVTSSDLEDRVFLINVLPLRWFMTRNY